MRKGRWRLVSILILPAVFLMAQPLRTANCVLELNIPERIEIALSVPVVDLGEPAVRTAASIMSASMRSRLIPLYAGRLGGTDFGGGFSGWAPDNTHLPATVADGRQDIPGHADEREVCGVSPQAGPPAATWYKAQ